MSAFITVNGVQFPWPDHDNGLQTTSTLVTSGYNANGVLVGQQIGRTKSKIELQWNVLDAQVWASMLQQFRSSPVAAISYYDMEQGVIVTRQMQVSDRTAQPLRVDPNTGAWLTAQQCKLTLTDTGA